MNVALAAPTKKEADFITKSELIHQEVTADDAMVVNVDALKSADFTARFAAKGRDLFIVLPHQQILLQGYYPHTPILIDKQGNRFKPQDVAESIASALHVKWGERARVFISQLPANCTLPNEPTTLVSQGKSGFLTANNEVLRDGDTFSHGAELIYYHNETGNAWDEIKVAQEGRSGVLGIVVN